MKKTIRLSENELITIIKKIINEEMEDEQPKELSPEEWEKIWLRGRENPIPDNIMMLLIKSHPRENNGKYCQFLKLCNLFQIYIGKTYEITQDEYNHIHPLLIKSVQKVINRTITKEDLREVLLNNMLS